MLALTKTLRDGRTATVTVTTDNHGVVYTEATVDGKSLGSHVGPHHRRPNLPAGHVAAVGRLALTPEEAAYVEDAYRTARATASTLPVPLTEQRHRLNDILRAAVLDRSEAQESAWDDFDGGGNPFSLHPGFDQAIETAQRGLTQFDRAHPEIREAEVQRAIHRALTD